MRNIITISVPPEQKKSMNKMIKDYNYSSVSEFFRDAVRALQENKLIKDMMESEREFASGKGRKLSSLKDLM
jgi:Arc/MetJ-type ribon-helix-helix transcriptional regulator